MVAMQASTLTPLLDVQLILLFALMINSTAVKELQVDDFLVEQEGVIEKVRAENGEEKREILEISRGRIEAERAEVEKWARDYRALEAEASELRVKSADLEATREQNQTLRDEMARLEAEFRKNREEELAKIAREIEEEAARNQERAVETALVRERIKLAELVQLVLGLESGDLEDVVVGLGAEDARELQKVLGDLRDPVETYKALKKMDAVRKNVCFVDIYFEENFITVSFNDDGPPTQPYRIPDDCAGLDTRKDVRWIRHIEWVRDLLEGRRDTTRGQMWVVSFSWGPGGWTWSKHYRPLVDLLRAEFGRSAALNQVRLIYTILGYLPARRDHD